MAREKLGSRLGFILLSAGCAIGIGNVWKFPSMVGQNGGGIFVLIYLFFLIVLGVPVMTMEFSIGRAAQKSPAAMHSALAPKRGIWQAHGKTLTITNCVATQDGEIIDIKSKIGGSKLAQNTVKVDGDYFVTSSEALKAAIEAKASKIILANGDYSVRFTNNTSFNADNMTFVGFGDKVNVAVTSSEVWYGRIQGDNMTFENIHFTSSVGSTGKATYNNCVFDDWTICAISNVVTAFNKCTIKGCLNTSSDFNSGNVYVKDSKIAKAEYSFSSDASSMNFENCEIGELISWNATTVLTNCNVTTLDDTHMTTNTITVK